MSVVIEKESEKTEQKQKKKVNLICSRNTIDGVYPPLILAINAAREGADAKVFFTFGGIEILLKKNYENDYKNVKYHMPGFIGAIPGMTKLATWMIKKKIGEANIPDVKELIEMAQLEGVKFIACLMTMDMMGLTEKDLIEDVEVMDANQFMKLALASDLNMFT
jgi:peroxiredoxin family protein